MNFNGEKLVGKHFNKTLLAAVQVELTGSSIFDYVHQADHAELAEQIGVTLAGLGGNDNESEEGGGGQGPAPAIPDGKPCKW